MGWITPKVTWTPEPIYNADLSRIEGNLKYLREETATFNGLKSFSGGLSITGGVLNARPNTDTIHTLGRGKIFGNGNRAYFSHYDNDSTNTYSVMQDEIGNSYFNSKWSTLYIRGNSDKPIARFIQGDKNPTLQLRSTYNGEDWTVGEKQGSLEFYSSDASGTHPAVIGGIYAYTGNSSGNANGLRFNINNGTTTSELGMTLDYNKDLTVEGNIYGGALTCSTINTGQGANELYGMNQSVKTTDNVTFAGATINGALTCSTMRVGASGSVITEMKWL